MAKKGAVAGMLMNVHHGKMAEPKDTLQVHAHFGPDYGSMSNGDHMHKMDVEEHGHLTKKIKGIQGALDNWVPEDVAAQAHQSLTDELEQHKARHKELGERIKKHKMKKSKMKVKDGSNKQMPKEGSPDEEKGESPEFEASEDEATEG